MYSNSFTKSFKPVRSRQKGRRVRTWGIHKC